MERIGDDNAEIGGDREAVGCSLDHVARRDFGVSTKLATSVRNRRDCRYDRLIDTHTG
jgi:hypothetical protein